MSSGDALNATIAEALGIEASEVVDELAFESIEQWDSMGHVALITALEAELELEIDDDDVLELTTVRAIRDFVARARG